MNCPRLFGFLWRRHQWVSRSEEESFEDGETFTVTWYACTKCGKIEWP